MLLTGPSLRNMSISADTLFKSSGILKLNEIYKLELAKFMHRVTHNSVPKNISNMFIKIKSMHQYPTSSKRNRIFYQPRANSNAYKSWITSAGITFWESVNSELKSLTYKQFIKQYKNKLISDY